MSRVKEPFWKLLVLTLIVFSGSSIADSPLEGKHLGATSCASAQCHGSVKRYEGSRIGRNEYRLWARNDPHAKAYSALGSSRAKKIAERLGMDNAQTSKACLNCHSDNVPDELQGAKFKLSDGVGCEVCHGGSEHWIKPHAKKNVDREETLAQGMYRTDDVNQRAKLCLSCHYGAEDRFAGHQLMRAGHPRLSFELDTFTISQQHYTFDDDYISRKQQPDSVRQWAVGVLSTAEQLLELVASDRFVPAGPFPELSMFDCYACHHLMSDGDWKKISTNRITTKGLEPGAVPLNDSSLVLVYALSKAVKPGVSGKLVEQIQSLHKAVQSSDNEAISRADSLKQLLDSLQKDLRQIEFSDTVVIAIRKEILDMAGRGELRNYVGAEQATMALDLLTYALEEEQKYQAEIDRLYQLLDDENKFSASAWLAAANSFAKRLGG